MIPNSPALNAPRRFLWQTSLVVQLDKRGYIEVLRCWASKRNCQIHVLEKGSLDIVALPAFCIVCSPEFVGESWPAYLGYVDEANGGIEIGTTERMIVVTREQNLTLPKLPIIHVVRRDQPGALRRIIMLVEAAFRAAQKTTIRSPQ